MKLLTALNAAINALLSPEAAPQQANHTPPTAYERGQIDAELEIWTCPYPPHTSDWREYGRGHFDATQDGGMA